MPTILWDKYLNFIDSLFEEDESYFIENYNGINWVDEEYPLDKEKVIAFLENLRNIILDDSDCDVKTDIILKDSTYTKFWVFGNSRVELTKIIDINDINYETYVLAWSNYDHVWIIANNSHTCVICDLFSFANSDGSTPLIEDIFSKVKTPKEIANFMYNESLKYLYEQIH